MPVSNTIFKAYSGAANVTQSLAAQSGVSNSAVLAAQNSGALRGTPAPSLAAFKQSDKTHVALTQAVRQSCGAGGNARACSAASQNLGSYEALVTGPDGALTQALLRKRDESSIREWLTPPTRVLPIKTTTAEVGSVAVTLAALST